eukprot:320280-Chlamydomonas_euryale.AAC.2
MSLAVFGSHSFKGGSGGQHGAGSPQGSPTHAKQHATKADCRSRCEPGCGPGCEPGCEPGREPGLGSCVRGERLGRAVMLVETFAFVPPFLLSTRRNEKSEPRAGAWGLRGHARHEAQCGWAQPQPSLRTLFSALGTSSPIGLAVSSLLPFHMDVHSLPPPLT